MFLGVFIMRDNFLGFYSNEGKIEDVLKSDNVRIIFDTNVLLKIYEYQEETQKEFFDLLEKLGDKVWIPYHVGLEFQRNRISKIKDLKAEFNEATPLLKNVRTAFDTFKSKALLRKRIPALQEQTDNFEKTLTELVESYANELKEWDKKQPEVRSSDAVRAKLDTIFQGRVGDAPDQPWVNEADEAGAKRYKLKTPPGFKDGEEKTLEFNYADVKYQAKYGDWYLWKQSFESVAQDDNLTAVVFVTEDNKEDWWYVVNSNGKKTIGADACLREEMCRKGELKHYFQFNVLDFIEHASKAVNVMLDATSISDVKSRVINDSSLEFPVDIYHHQSKMLDWDSCVDSEYVDALFHKELVARIEKVTAYTEVGNYIVETVPLHKYGICLKWVRDKMIREYEILEMQHKSDLELHEYILKLIEAFSLRAGQH